MHIRAVFYRISRLQHLSRWYFHVSTESANNARMATSHPGKRRSILLVFANFYRRFIKGFYKIVQPLVAFTRKDLPFCSTLVEQSTFLALKFAFMSAPVLHPGPTKPFKVETNASGFAIGVILSEPNNDGVQHLIAYYSRKFRGPKVNYLIYDKELVAIISVFEEWRPYLVGAQHRVQVVMATKNFSIFLLPTP